MDAWADYRAILLDLQARLEAVGPRGLMDAWTCWECMQQDGFAMLLLQAPPSFKNWFYCWWREGCPSPAQGRFVWARRPLLPHEKPRPTCGARCKSTGKPCKITLVYRNGRCR